MFPIVSGTDGFGKPENKHEQTSLFVFELIEKQEAAADGLRSLRLHAAKQFHCPVAASVRLDKRSRIHGCESWRCCGFSRRVFQNHCPDAEVCAKRALFEACPDSNEGT